MNLHILPDSKFSNKLIQTIERLGITFNNQYLILSNNAKLNYVDNALNCASPNSQKFKHLVGNTYSYDKVFIHQFNPMLYKWVANNKFKKLYWAIWGADLYSIPGIELNLYEELTKDFFSSAFSWRDKLYKAKLQLIHSPYQSQAFAKVDYVLTWMSGEFEFAKKNIPSLRAEHIHFFYQNEFPYEDVDDRKSNHRINKHPIIIVGNSGTPANNHLDAIRVLASTDTQARIILPVSYGEKNYIQFLKKRIFSISGQLKIEFIDNFLTLNGFLDLLSSSDALIINSIRPQGYGTIFLSQLKRIPLFLNHKNISIPDLIKMQIKFYGLAELSKSTSKDQIDLQQNISNVKTFFSNQRVDSLYVNLFR
jgi:hypothetical protein